jgi:predicted enzyme related to lactoylglutathione lyase
MDTTNPKAINGIGIAHLAFEVEDAEEILRLIHQEGGGQVGELVKTDFPAGVITTFVYATDPEGNIIELKSKESS